MPVIPNPKKEKFARLYATKQGELSRREMVKRAGYGDGSTNDKYLSSCASRLLAEPIVAERIKEIRNDMGIPIDEEDIRKDMVYLLYNVVFGDFTKHMMLHTTTTKMGNMKQCALVKDTDFCDWSPIERKCVQGFDRVTGNPIFIDKMKAFDKLKELVIRQDDDKVVEDIKNAYFSAGLMYGLNNEPSNLCKFVNTEIDTDTDTEYESDEFIDEDEDTIDTSL